MKINLFFLREEKHMWASVKKRTPKTKKLPPLGDLMLVFGWL